MEIKPTEILELDFTLHTKTNLSPSLTFNEGIDILIAPNLLRDQTLYIEGLSVYNMSPTTVSLPEGTHLFSIHFVNIQSILAVPKEAIVKKALIKMSSSSHSSIVRHCGKCQMQSVTGECK